MLIGRLELTTLIASVNNPDLTRTKVLCIYGCIPVTTFRERTQDSSMPENPPSPTLVENHYTTNYRTGKTVVVSSPTAYPSCDNQAHLELQAVNYFILFKLTCYLASLVYLLLMVASLQPQMRCAACLASLLPVWLRKSHTDTLYYLYSQVVLY